MLYWERRGKLLVYKFYRTWWVLSFFRHRVKEYLIRNYCPPLG